MVDGFLFFGIGIKGISPVRAVMQLQIAASRSSQPLMQSETARHGPMIRCIRPSNCGLRRR